MCRKSKFASLAYSQALQSEMNFKHGAIITKGSKIIVSSMNHDNRTSTLGQIHSSVHAEIAVASKLINQFIRKKTRNRNEYKNYLKKYIIWVVRAPTYKTAQLKGEYCNSLPCRMCINKLMSLGFNKIGYSDENGEMVVTTLNKINEVKICPSQAMLGEYYKY